MNTYKILCLIGVSKTTHAAHHTEHIVVSGIHANLGGVFASNRVVGKDKLKGGVINTGHVASS